FARFGNRFKPTSCRTGADRARSSCRRRSGRTRISAFGRLVMIPGELFPKEGEIELNAGCETITLLVANRGDRAIQVGSHYHFAEANPALEFDRSKSRGWRLDIPAGSAVRFEPGQSREVTLTPFRGARRVFGFNGEVMGPLD